MKWKGTWRIIQFNYPFYLGGLIAVMSGFIAGSIFPEIKIYLWLISILIGIQMLLGLAASWWIYDVHSAYQLPDVLLSSISNNPIIANIHAGYDESTEEIKKQFSFIEHLDIYDFYDAKKHTEPSIARARKWIKHQNISIAIQAQSPQLMRNYDVIFLMYAIHEMRNRAEQLSFLKTLSQFLSPSGKIIILEHPRNALQWVVYNVGALHFYSNKYWLRLFSEGNFNLKIYPMNTPFTFIYVLENNSTIKI